MVGGIFLLVLAGGAVAIVLAIRSSMQHRSPADHPPGEFRRAAELLLLGGLCIVTTIGVAGLLTRLIDAIAGDVLVDDVSALARGLAFTFVGGPLTALAWRWRWRHTGPTERTSPVWAAFLVVMSTVALLFWAIGGLDATAWWIRARLDVSGLASAIAWAGAWAGFRWVHRRSDRSPTRLPEAAPTLGSVIGLGLALGYGIDTVQRVVARALESSGDVLVDVGGAGWWRGVAGSLVAAAAGAAIWARHWFGDGTRRASGVGAQVALVLSGIVVSAALTMVGGGMALYDLIRPAGDDVGLSAASPSFALAIAFATVGALAWAYHHHVVAERTEDVRWSSGLVVSGMGLVTAATGLGIIVNAAIGSAASTLVGSGMRQLLMAGVSVAAVGAPVWAVAWRPGVQITDPERRHWTGRQVYLIVVFGVAAATALGTLLFVAFQIIQDALRTTPQQDLLERIRGALGLLTATLLVAAYHFPVWRRDRTIRERRPGPTIAHVVLVGPAPALDALRAAVHESTGARVTTWVRADDGPAPDPAIVCAALATVAASRVLVVTGGPGGVEVVPLG